MSATADPSQTQNCRDRDRDRNKRKQRDNGQHIDMHNQNSLDLIKADDVTIKIIQPNDNK